MTAVITFDAGQTLIELDLDFLAGRLVARGVAVEPAALWGAAPAAWQRYDAIVEAGQDHATAWRALIGAIVRGAGVEQAHDHVEWLYAQNASANLWRKPIAGMIEIARELAGRGFRVGVLSNSEGRLAELLGEIGMVDAFAAVIDSRLVGLEKPDPRIFEHAFAVLGGVPGDAAIHVGDSWDADVIGARAAEWRAIWFGRRAAPVDDPEVATAHDAVDVRAALARWGI